MKQIRVLLLSLGPAGKVGSALKNLLQSAPGISLSCMQESTDLLKSAGNRVQDITLSLSPDLLILTTLSSELARFQPVYESLSPEDDRLPGIAFLETNDLSNITAVDLQSGTIVMIPDHLSSVDISLLVTRLADGFEPEQLFSNSEKVSWSRQLVGRNSLFLDEVKKIPIIAKYNSSVLIWGEVGTGKEICARLIHQQSPRAGNPFIIATCGAIPIDFADHELFGQTSGALGAVFSKPGVFRQAEDGTLFLNEIDCLPPLVQIKVLRFLQEKTYRPTGSVRNLRADVRVIAAVNMEPEQAVRSGRLRKDLYYRLNVVSLWLPPLRERKDDIPLLARHFAEKSAIRAAKRIDGFSARALQKLNQHDWPGNLREFESVIERAVLFCPGRTIEEQDIFVQEREKAGVGISLKEMKERYVEQFEKTYIERLLLVNRGNISRAAQAAKKHRRAFYQLMRKYEIDARKFKAENRQAHWRLSSRRGNPARQVEPLRIVNASRGTAPSAPPLGSGEPLDK